MPILPPEMYERSFITYNTGTQKNHLAATMTKDGLTISVVNKVALTNFEKFLVWIGWYTPRIVDVSAQLNTHINEFGSNRFVQALIKGKTHKEIQYLALNLWNLNKKIDSYNEKASYISSVRKTALKIDREIIDTLILCSTERPLIPSTPPRVPPPAQPQPGIAARMYNGLSAIRRTPPPPPRPLSVEEQLSAVSARTQNPPNVIPYTGNGGNTCHFDSTINFLAGLPPVVDVIQKANPDGEEFREFQRSAAAVITHQATKSTPLPDGAFAKLMGASRVGRMQGQDINRQQDAHEDVAFFMENLGIDQNGRSSPRISSRLAEQLIFKEYTTKPIQPTVNASEINLTAAELENMEPFSWTKSQIANQLNLQITDIDKNKNYTSFEESLSGFFKPEQISAGNEVKPYVRTSDGKYYQVIGRPIKNSRIMDAPEVLMVTYKRFKFNNPNSRKLEHIVETPERPVISGKYFTDGKAQKYVLCSVIRQRGDVGGGHYWALHKRQGKWFKINDTDPKAEELSPDQTKTELDNAYVYGYVREDIYEKYRVRERPITS